jgi:hypothetical protein
MGFSSKGRFGEGLILPAFSRERLWSRISEKAIEVIKDVGDELLSARVFRIRRPREQAEQVAGFLDCLGPCARRGCDQHGFERVLAAPESNLVGFHISA